MLTTRKIGSCITHNPQLSIQEVVKKVCAESYAAVRNIQTQYKIDFELALASYLRSESPLCLWCGVGPRIRTSRKNMLKTCSKKCADALRSHNTGVSCVETLGGRGFAAQSIAKAAKRTMKTRYGVQYSGQSEELRAKASETLMRVYGVQSSFQTPAANAARARNNTDKEILAKRNEAYHNTMNSKYGNGWRAHKADALASARYKWKEVAFGKYVFKVQGYEPYLIKELVARGCKPKLISVYSQHFMYYNPVLKQEALYRPDVFVDTYKKIYEVKSDYTAGLRKGKNEKEWKILQAKSKAVSAAGNTLTLVVINEKKGWVSIPNPHRLTRKQAQKKLLNYKPFTFTD